MSDTSYEQKQISYNYNKASLVKTYFVSPREITLFLANHEEIVKIDDIFFINVVSANRVSVK
jgi:hypothetical protein